MNRNIICAFALTMFLSPTLPARADDSVGQCDYYPLKAGSTWEGKFMNKPATIKVARHEKFGDAMCAVIETTIDGKVVATEHISVAKDGLYKNSIEGKQADPPVRILALPVKDGDNWQTQTKALGQVFKSQYKASFEDVAVPAGTFKKALLVTSESEVFGRTINGKVWYAKDVGIVRASTKFGDTEVNFELDKYIPAK